ncbi:MAG: FAD-dependent oxidoreductase [Gammaproteobacteria bacterium]|nr:FAD-dependent oxidoreductase [Gammaproteobacteria bacterium]
MDKVDCVIVGAGVVGLAVAAELAKQGREVVVLEQHELIGSETSSRNSEVIHAGIYYPTNSLKAKFCVRGKQLLYDYCASRGVDHKRCGKIIVAANESQRATVEQYISKASANGVADLYWIDEAELGALEPEVQGIGAVVSPSTGIVDSHGFMLSLQGEMEAHGGALALGCAVQSIEPRGTGSAVHGEDFSIAADWVINCAGLTAPALAAGLTGAPQAYYAKGHYYSYAGRQPFSRLVYPVAEAGGLGVHVTLDLAGQIKFGPDVRWLSAVDYSFDDSHKDEFAAAIRAYFPGLDASRLQPSYTGIRPKISGPSEAAADFMLPGPEQHGVPGRLNLLGIESPGLTASLALAEAVAGQLS